MFQWNHTVIIWTSKHFFNVEIHIGKNFNYGKNLKKIVFTMLFSVEIIPPNRMLSGIELILEGKNSITLTSLSNCVWASSDEV